MPGTRLLASERLGRQDEMRQALDQTNCDRLHLRWRVMREDTRQPARSSGRRTHTRILNVRRQKQPVPRSIAISGINTEGSGTRRLLLNTYGSTWLTGDPCRETCANYSNSQISGLRFGEAPPNRITKSQGRSGEIISYHLTTRHGPKCCIALRPRSHIAEMTGRTTTSIPTRPEQRTDKAPTGIVSGTSRSTTEHDSWCPTHTCGMHCPTI